MSVIKRWLITGASGAIGLQVLKRMFKDNFSGIEVVATDVRPLPKFLSHPKLSFLSIDIRSDKIRELLVDGNFHGIIHLASIVSPGKKSNREFEYSVDVLGTKNILEAAKAANVKQIIVTSSGAAYGYHSKLPEWIQEEEPAVGNEVFAYSWHKKLVEDMLADYRQHTPELKQLILRPGTVLGSGMKNQITDLFEKPMVIGILGCDSPFVFIWDQDVAEIIYQGMVKEKSGIFNLAGDGKITNLELAKILKKPLIKIPSLVLQFILKTLKSLNLTQYGPEQIAFLKYRPVLDNSKLKKEFGYVPTYSSKEVLENFLKPQKNFYIYRPLDPANLSPLKVFTQFDRLDALIIESKIETTQQKEELLNWISYFEGQKSGLIYLLDEHGNLKDSEYVQSSHIKLCTLKDIEQTKKLLIYSKNEIFTALPTI